MSQDPTMANPYWHQPSKRQRVSDDGDGDDDYHQRQDDLNGTTGINMDNNNLPPQPRQHDQSQHQHQSGSDTNGSMYPHNLALLDVPDLEQLRSMTQQFEQNLNGTNYVSSDNQQEDSNSNPSSQFVYLDTNNNNNNHSQSSLVLPPSSSNTIPSAISHVTDSSAGQTDLGLPSSSIDPPPHDGDINVGWLQHHNITALDGIAAQILHMIGTSPYQVVMSVYSNPQGEDTGNLMSLLAFLNSIRNMYTSEPFFSAPCFETYKREYHNYIIPFRKANMAVFIASIYGFEKNHFYHLDKYFLDTFAGNDGFLMPEAASVFLELKTQAFISAITVQPDGNKNEILDYLFPQDVAKVLVSRRDIDRLSPTEQDFVVNSSNRRQALGNESSVGSSILLSQYSWDSFVHNFTGFAYSQVDKILNNNDNNNNASSSNEQQQPSQTSTPHQLPAAQTTTRPEPPQRYRSSSSDVQSHGEPPSVKSSGTSSTPGPTSFVDSISDEQLLSMSTYDAYVYARKALASCVTKPQVTAALAQRRPQSSRQTWTTVEEKALCDGLDLVKGPYWSQILELYGPNGKIDDALKGRNAVQLKDKARNLKLVFLKVGKPIPEPLRSVTGKLKTNTPKSSDQNKGDRAPTSHQGASTSSASSTSSNNGQRRASAQQQQLNKTIDNNQIPMANARVSVQGFSNYIPRQPIFSSSSSQPQQHVHIQSQDSGYGRQNIELQNTPTHQPEAVSYSDPNSVGDSSGDMSHGGTQEHSSVPQPDGHNGISDLYASAGSSSLGIVDSNNSPASIPESSIPSGGSGGELDINQTPQQPLDENGEAAILAQLTSDPNALMNLLSNMGSDLDQASFERLIQLSAQSLAR